MAEPTFFSLGCTSVIVHARRAKTPQDNPIKRVSFPIRNILRNDKMSTDKGLFSKRIVWIGAGVAAAAVSSPLAFSTFRPTATSGTICPPILQATQPGAGDVNGQCWDGPDAGRYRGGTDSDRANADRASADRANADRAMRMRQLDVPTPMGQCRSRQGTVLMPIAQWDRADATRQCGRANADRANARSCQWDRANAIVPTPTG